MNRIFICISIALSSLLPQLGFSQQPVVSIDKVLLNIESPWGLTFINNNELLFTEKRGKVWKYNILTDVKTEITGLPAITQNGQGGLLDIVLHPDFSTNKYVYLTYAVEATGGQTTAMGRGVLSGNQLQNFTELFRALPIVNSGVHFGSRLVFDKNNFLYMSVGERGNGDNAQNRNTHLGKVLRFKDDGSVPTDNPFVNVANVKPEIYSFGHRNIQGIAMHPATGEIYAHEHGPQGGDELNIIKKGANYGWPNITYGVPYGSSGTTLSKDTVKEGIEPPLTYWIPTSIAPSGLTFINNGQPNNEMDVLIGALAGKHLQWVKLTNNKKVFATKSLQDYARFRDVRQAPNGVLYALTEGPNQLIRLKTNVNITSVSENNDAKEMNVVIYPNPGTDNATLRITSPLSQNVIIKISNSNGVLAYPEFTKEIVSGTNMVEMPSSQLPKGVYHVEVINGHNKYVVKWVRM